MRKSDFSECAGLPSRRARIQECQSQITSEMTSVATIQRTQMAPNQSSSCPLSSTICRQPLQMASSPKPRPSKAPNLGVLDVGRIVDKAADENDRHNADGNVDVKGIAPAKSSLSASRPAWVPAPAPARSLVRRRPWTSNAFRSGSSRAEWTAKAAAARRHPLLAGPGPAE